MAIQPSDYLSLSVREREQLITEIAVSIFAEAGDSGLPTELEAELDRRVAIADANPGSGISWEECKLLLQNRT